MKLLCVFTKVLGGKTVAAYFKEIIDNMTEVDSQYFYLETKDYKNYPASKSSQKLGSTFETLEVVKNKWQHEGVDIEKFDGLFFSGYEITAAFKNDIKRIPSMLRLDTTPQLAQELIRQEGGSLLKMLRSKVSALVMNMRYGPIFRNMRYIFTATEWAKDSLIETYGVSPERVIVCYPSRDLNVWKSDDSCVNDTKRLLFIGNDFKRKGGEFLMDLYKKLLRGKYLLRIVSNDPIAKECANCDGVEVISGVGHENVSDFVRLFQTSDLFVFPTWREQLGIVLTEAISVGLPVVARDVGGISDIVRNEFNGCLMKYDSTLDEWSKAIDMILSDHLISSKYAENSRSLAKQYFDREKNGKEIQSIIGEFAKAGK